MLGARCMTFFANGTSSLGEETDVSSYLTHSFDKLMRTYNKEASLVLSGPEEVRAPKKTFF